MLDPILQYLLAAISFAFLLISILLYPGKKKTSFLLLMGGAFCLRLYMAQLDPFLNLWDERFHALVAKNLLLEPFTPMLIANPVMPYSIESWSNNHVWLHKQPLFLWQIALFFKIFGVNEFVLRLPSVIMLTGIVYFIYRIGYTLINERSGFYGAWLFAVSYYGLQLTSGLMSMEHNDIAFVFYVTASIWAWAEYQASGMAKWLYVIGIASGCAILVKWLTGLLVYSGWGIVLLTDPRSRWRVSAYLPLLKSLVVTVLVFLPWQIYIMWQFPAESAYEYAYNTRHIFEAVEGHGGTVWFHLENLSNLYGKYITWLISIGLFFVYQQFKESSYRIAYFTYILVVYFFFSVIVASKLPTYVYVVSPLIFLALGAFLGRLFTAISTFQIPAVLQRAAVFCISIIIGYQVLRPKDIVLNHTTENIYGVSNYREAKIFNTTIYKRLPKLLEGKKIVVFNCRPLENIDVMFYTPFTAYDYLPSEEDIRKIKAKGLKIAVFDSGNLPEHIQSDSTIFKIEDRLL